MTPSRGMTPERNFFVGKFRKNSGQTRTGKKGRGDTPQASDTRWKSIKVTVMSKKSRQFFQDKINRGDTAEMADGDDKKGQLFQEKIGVTPIAASGDTNPSDATGRHH